VKEYLRQLAAQADNDLARSCLVREYLQARVIESLQDTGTFLRWAFAGGTALRFLFSIPRFSEDLDFSLIKAGEDAGFRTALTEVKRALSLEGYRIEINVNDQKTVASAWLKFPGLPHEIGLSPHPSQALSIKVETDTRPPPGAGIATSIVRRHVTLNLCHYDQVAASLCGSARARSAPLRDAEGSIGALSRGPSGDAARPEGIEPGGKPDHVVQPVSSVHA
jgi:hypothetical protein